MSAKFNRGLLAAVVFAVALSLFSATAEAVLSGTNGRLVIVSGRDQPSDATAKLFLRPVIGSVGGGAVVPVPTATGADQHRHPTWSPDRTRIAYAHGAAGNFDIFILDLTNPAATPQNITNSNNVTDDRPAWSPDGTRIAFESENADASGQLNIKLYDVQTQNTTNFTSTGAGFEHKPAWTPDSQTLYYTTGDPNGTDTMNIVRQPADASAGPSNVLQDPTANEFQPSISPNGTRMCFTRGTGAGFNATARVRVALANGGGQTELPGNTLAATAGYNCTWSPDGQYIAYVQGTFSNGDLVMEDSDTAPPLTLNFLETTIGRFDGNPDWAPDGPARCEDQEFETGIDQPVTVPLDCADTGPVYEQTDVQAQIAPDARPANGTLSATGPLPVPGNVTYTPNPGFRGTDTFRIQAFDEIAFGDREGTVTINVLPPSNDFSFGKLKRNKRKGTAKLTVNLPGPGDVELAATRKLKGAAKRAEVQGSLKLKLTPKKGQRAKLAKKGKAKVQAKVTYTPDKGDPNTKTKKVKLKRKRR